MGMSNITKQRCYIYGFDMEAENALAYTEVPKGEFRQWLISSVTNEVILLLQFFRYSFVRILYLLN